MTASIHQLPLKSRRFAAKAAALPNATAGVAPTLELGRLSRRVQFGIAGWRPTHATRQAPGPDARRRRAEKLVSGGSSLSDFFISFTASQAAVWPSVILARLTWRRNCSHDFGDVPMTSGTFP